MNSFHAKIIHSTITISRLRTIFKNCLKFITHNPKDFSLNYSFIKRSMQKLIILHDFYQNQYRSRLCLSTRSYNTYNNIDHVQASTVTQLNASSIRTEIWVQLNHNAGKRTAYTTPAYFTWDFFHNLSRSRLCLSTRPYNTYNNIDHVQASQSIRLNASSIRTEIRVKLNSQCTQTYCVRNTWLFYMRLFP